MGSITLIVMTLMVCGARGGLIREWRTYVPYYASHTGTPYIQYYSGTYNSHLLPTAPGNDLIRTLGYAPRIGEGQNGVAPLGQGTNHHGATEGSGAPRTGGAQAPRGDGSQNGGSSTQSGNRAYQIGNAQAPAGQDLWSGYIMYQPSGYPALLAKVNGALRDNGGALTAIQINFAGYKAVGSESQTGPAVISLVNFTSNYNKNCYAYMVEATMRNPEIPKDSIVCTT